MKLNPEAIPQQMGSLALFHRTNHVSSEKRTVSSYLTPAPWSNSQLNRPFQISDRVPISRSPAQLKSFALPSLIGAFAGIQSRRSWWALQKLDPERLVVEPRGKKRAIPEPDLKSLGYLKPPRWSERGTRPPHRPQWPPFPQSLSPQNRPY